MKLKFKYTLGISIFILIFSLISCSPPELISAKVYIENNELQKAKEKLEIAKDKYPNNPKVYYLLASEIYIPEGKTEKALGALNKTLKLDSSYKDKVNNLKRKIGRYDSNLSSNKQIKIECLFVDNKGIHYINEKTKLDTILFPLNNFYTEEKLSPDENKLLLSYFKNDSIILSTINLNTLKHNIIFKLPKQYIYSFDWSPSGDKIAFGYYTEEKKGGKFVADEGNICLYNLENDKLDTLRCSLSKQVHNWISNGDLVVSSGRGYKNLYIVDSADCSTINKIIKKGSNHKKSNITFSPDGLKYFYINNREAYVGRNKKDIFELYVSYLSNSEKKLIADYSYHPHNPSWSPDSKKIVFEVKCQEYHNIKHLAIYKMGQDNAKIYTGGKAHGIVSDENPIWSKKGRFVIFDRNYYESYDSHSISDIIYQKQVWDYNKDENYLIKKTASKGIGSTIKWVDNKRFLLGNKSWVKIYNYKGKMIKQISSSNKYLYIKTIQ